MASRMLRSQPLRIARPFAQHIPTNSSRSLVSVAAPSGLRHSTAVKPSLQQSALRQTFRRHYADQAPQAMLSPAATKPKKRRGVFKTIWRITQITFLGGVAYLAYTVYDLKNPPDQFEPDPSKKTLVVLGMWFLALLPVCTKLFVRIRLGRDFPTKEARYRKLQRYRRLTPKLFPVHSSPAIMYNRVHRTSIYHGADSKHPPTQESCREVL